MRKIKVDGRSIGEEFNPFVVPEIGINHEGEISKAKRMVEDAADSGAECVKFQMHIVESEMIDDEVVPVNANKSIQEIIRRCSLTRQEHEELKAYVESFDMTYLCTPFSREASNILDEMGVAAFKIGSGECNNYPFVEHIASFGKPVILSTGMNQINSIDRSVNILRDAGVSFAVLQCTSMYPTPYSKANLGAIDELLEHYSDAVVGLSDHTPGIYIPLAAVAKGAAIIEKHFVSDKDWPGPDVPVSIDPEELTQLIEGINAVYAGLGGGKSIVEGEELTSKFAFASVVAIQHIKKGEELSGENIWVKRPGTGEILADVFNKLLGRRAARDIAADTQLTWEHVEE
jgi:N-acetylneuraminate synthase